MRKTLSHRSQRLRLLSTSSTGAVSPTLISQDHVKTFKLEGPDSGKAVLFREMHQFVRGPKEIYVLYDYDRDKNIRHRVSYTKFTSEDQCDFTLVPYLLKFGEDDAQHSPTKIQIKSLSDLPAWLQPFMVLNEKFEGVSAHKFNDPATKMEGCFFEITDVEGYVPQYLALFKGVWWELMGHDQMGPYLCVVDKLSKSAPVPDSPGLEDCALVIYKGGEDRKGRVLEPALVKPSDISQNFMRLLRELKFYHNHESVSDEFTLHGVIASHFVTIVCNPDRITVLKRSALSGNLNSVTSYDTLHSFKDGDKEAFSGVLDYFFPGRTPSPEPDSEDEMWDLEFGSAARQEPSKLKPKPSLLPAFSDLSKFIVPAK